MYLYILTIYINEIKSPLCLHKTVPYESATQKPSQLSRQSESQNPMFRDKTPKERSHCHSISVGCMP